MPDVRTLAAEIWLLDEDVQVHQLIAYRDHYNDAKSFIWDDNVRIHNISDVLTLVAAIKQHPLSSTRDIKLSISSTQQSFLTKSFNDASVLAALKFAVRLWLFTPIDDCLGDEDESLKAIIERKVTSSSIPGPSVTTVERLSHDLCEKNLTRKAGMKLVWTSDLSEHLQLMGDSTLKIFRHASILNSLADADAEAAAFFPDGFLTETEYTIALLFPAINQFDSKRTRRIGEKHNVDIEAGVSASRELSDYVYWRARLADIQRVYDDAKPKRVKQWYFDRRNKEAWATFWIAVIVFFFTLFFGIISSVTGILQVYIAFKSANSALVASPSPIPIGH